MTLTPEQARAELERRRALKAQTTAPVQPATPSPQAAALQPVAKPSITPEQARAELARRRALRQAPQPSAPSLGERIKSAAVGAAKRTFTPEGLTPVTSAATSFAEDTATNIAQSGRERPVETFVQTVSPLAIGATSAAGSTLGPVGTAAGFTGGLAATSTAQRFAQDADRKLYELTGGIVGNAKPKESEISNAIGILAEQTLGVVIPVAGSKALGALQRSRLNRLQSMADDLATKATTPEQIAKLNAVKAKLAEAGVTGAQTAQRLGDDKVFNMNGMRLDDAAAKIKGEGWESRTFGGTLTAGKPSDFGETGRMLSTFTGKLGEQNSKRVLDIVSKDAADYNAALLPKTNAFKSLDEAKSKLDASIVSKKKALQESQKVQERAVFAPQPANTPILGSELIRVFDDPEVVASMSAAGFGGETGKLAAIRASIGGSGPRTTTDLARMMSKIQSQLVSKDDAEARRRFYDVVFPKLKSVFETAAQSPSSAASQYSKSVLNFFENRFGLADTGEDLIKSVLSNKPEEALNVLASRESFASAQRAFGRFADQKSFGDYLRTVIASASKDQTGQPQAHLLNQALNKINLDIPEVVQALGKDYVDNLKALQTVLNAEAMDGTKAQLVQLAMGKNAAKAKEVADGFRDLAINTAAMNPLGQGAATSNIGRSLFSPLLQPDVRTPTVSRAAIGEVTVPNNAITKLASGAAVAAGGPAIYGYDTTQEQQAKARAMLSGGQGGSEEAAPSMAPERDFDALLRGDAEVAPNDELSQLIDQATLHSMMDDDVDMLVKQQLKEDTKVASKVSTRQEEGFRTRMYRDTRGFRTVGVGFNMDAGDARKIWRDLGIKTKFDDVLAGRTAITRQEAETLYAHTKNQAKAGAARLVKNFNQIGEHRQAALADMVFQLGLTGAMAWHETRKLIEQGNYAAAARRMTDPKRPNFQQTPNRVLRRAYMLQHNVSLAEADAALVKAGKISAKESINNPQELSKLMEGIKVAAVPQPMATPAKRKRPTYAQAKANKGIA